MAVTINCPAPMTISCDVDPQPAVSGEAAGFTTCQVSEEVVIAWSDDASQLTGCSNTGNLIRTWTATDACGETQSCIQVITLEDVTSPTIMCPPTMMISCEQDTSPVSLGFPAASDNCGTEQNMLITYSNDTDQLDGCNGTGTFTRLWNATDPCGNTAVCTQTVIVSDVTPPTLTCPPDTEIACSGSVDPEDIGLPTASDACTPQADLLIDHSDNVLGLTGCNGTGTMIRTWAANDACGNMSICTQVITVVDNDIPTINCPQDVQIDCSDSTDPTNTGSADAEDACGIVNVSFSDDLSQAEGCNGTGQISRTWTATDGCSNTNTCVQVITVTDNTSPTVTCPESITVDCSLGLLPEVTGNVEVDDNCTSIELLDISYVDEPDMLTGCNGTGTFQRNWTVADACGNETSCAQIIQVIDESAPEVTCPSDRVIQCSSSVDPVDVGSPEYSDNCTPTEDLIASFSDDGSNASGCNGTGMIERTWTITDACNNTSSCVQTLMIIDDIQPDLTCAPELTISCEEDQSPSNTGWSAALDNCTAENEINIDYSDVANLNECNGTGTLIRTWTAADDCGNSISCTQIIHVIDETAPVILCPADIEISCTESTNPDDIGYPDGSDQCTPSEELEIHYADDLSGLTGCMATGSIVRNWTVLDACGNISACSQTITIADNQAPVIICPADAIVSCEDDLSPDTQGNATADDDCTPAQMIAMNYTDNIETLPGCNGTGILVRTWSAADACGNESNCNQTIQVRDETAPEIQCPASLTYDCSDDLSPDVIGSAIVSDNCSPVEFIAVTFEDDDSGLTGCNGTGNKLRTWTAYDLCGNESQCVQTMTIVDETAPALTCPDDNEISCESSLDTSIVGNISVADNCTPFDELDIAYSDTEQGLVGCNGSGSIVRTWTVEDACGNISTCAQQISVVDQTPPTIACNEPIEIDCGTSQDTSAVKPPVVTDNCSLPSEVQILFFDNATQLNGCNGTGTLIRNWIAFDGCGNMATCDQIIDVVDRTPPVITVPAPVTVNCELADDMGVLGEAVAVDNCSPDNDVFVYYEDNDAGLTGCNGTGLKERLWIATDGCGNIDTTIQYITLIDTLAPLFYCPLDVEVFPTDDIYDFDELGEVEVLVDNCAPVENVIIEYADDVVNLLDCESSPVISRTWSVGDQCGNIGTCVQRIQVNDYSAPKPTFPEDLVMDCNDDLFDMSLVGSPDLGSGVASLLVDTVYYVDMQFAEKENNFVHMREWYVIDYCAHVTKDTQYISVKDFEAPELTVAAIELTFVEQGSFDILIEDLLVSASDNCTPEIEFSVVPDVLTCSDFLNTNTQTITVTATDDHGNETVVQTQASVVDPQVTLTCPGDIIIELGSGECDMIANYVVEAVAACGPEPVVNQTDGTGLTSGDYYPQGTTMQTFEVTDALGTSTSCSFTVTVNPFPAGQFLICNDLINVSIDEQCVGQITPDVILEGDSYGCYDNYDIYSTEPGVQIIDGNLQAEAYIGQLLEVCIEDTTTGNYCCGMINLEDKLPPVLECTNDTLSCTADTDPLTINLFPVPDDSQIIPLQNGGFAVTGVDNCNASTLTYEDEVEVNMCEGDYIQIITRTWTATDLSGNTASCTQMIYLERGLFEEIVFPGDTTLECGSICILEDGTTDPACTGEPQGEFCGQFFFAHDDKIIQGCGGTYAIKRTWTLVDWCNQDNLINHVQIINIDDTQGPVLACQDTLYVPLDQGMCISTLELTPPAATDGCMSDSITFELRDALQTYEDVNGVWTIGELGIGHYTFTWEATDACGNRTQCPFVVEIVDNVTPVAYCDQHTVVAIQNDDQYGVTVSPAIVFDDGSFDACSDVTFRVRRMNSCIDFDWNSSSWQHQPDGIVNGLDRGTTFMEYVPFSCCDVASEDPVMVQLEVTDASGNVNYCMVEVTVQDKIAPEIVCPPHIEVSCNYWFDDNELDNLSNRTFGTVVDGFLQDESDRQEIVINDPGNPNLAQPHHWGIDGYATDNCNMDLSLSVQEFDDCSGSSLPGNAPEGAIRLFARRFLAVDPSGKSSFCQQNVWIVNYDPFYINKQDPNDPTDDVDWPEDIEVNNCGIPDTIFPTIYNEDCGSIAISMEEEKFLLDEGSCMKLFRHWTIIDWCQYNSNTGAGLWRYTQIVKITDDASAIFTDCPDGTLVLCSEDERVEDVAATLQEPNPCGAHIRFEHNIEDVCSEIVKYDVKIYPFNGSASIQVLNLTNANLEDGAATLVFDSKQSDVFNIANGGMPYNDPFVPSDAHRILWTVEDACGNIAACSYLFRLEDCKQPTPVCINGISTVVMPSSGEILIWADDFNASSTDNCTPDQQLRFSFTENVNQTSRRFACDNTPGFGIQIPVEVYVWDAWGNKDFCTTTIVVMDNENACGMSSSGLSGSIATNDPEAMVEHATVELRNPNSYFSEVITSDDGFYAFPSIPAGTQYEVSVSRDDEPKNGVSSLDLIRIQKHLLSTQPITDPYEMIAADINNNENISGVDLIELRKLILGVYTDFPDNESWRFVPKSFDFVDPFNPWPFDETVVMNIDSGDVMYEDFVAVKIGDLNASVVANATQVVIRGSAGQFTMEVDDLDLNPGQEHVIPVRAGEEMEINGLQFTLSGELAEQLHISGGALPIGNEHFAHVRGQVSVSWTDAASTFVEKGDVLFNIHVHPRVQMRLSSGLKLTSEIAAAEIYDDREEIYDLELGVVNPMITNHDSEIALYQNKPNPFNDLTVIGFDLPEESKIVLNIFDMTGRQLKSVQGIYGSGYQEIEILASELGAAGIYYYTLEVGEQHLFTKKMILQSNRQYFIRLSQKLINPVAPAKAPGLFVLYHECFCTFEPLMLKTQLE